MLALYGTVPDATRRRVHVVVAGVCVNYARPDVAAAFRVYWSDNSAHNRGFGILGRQLDSRALLQAILFALTVANPSRVVDISTTSKYAIRSICYLAGGNHTWEWTCANSDLLELIARAIQARTAQTVFTFIDSPRDLSAYREAHAIAMATCLDPERDVVEVITCIPPPSETCLYVGAPATVPRVCTAFEKADPPAPRARTTVTVAQLAVADKPEAHRNRVVYVANPARANLSDLIL
jgi:ribonuclease HI